MGSVECFMIERTNLARESLRRFVFSDKNDDRPKCTGPYGYHNASIMIAEQVPFESQWEGSGTGVFAHDDPRWPKACPCGYVFQDRDEWQHNLERLYRLPDGRLVDPDREAPPGAMWMFNIPEWDFRGPDGMTLNVMLPDGTAWCPDSPANNSKQPWERTGVPPKVTARPSILTPKYHGFLTDGRLESC